MVQPFRPRGDGLDLFVRLTPKAATDALQGFATAADGSVHLKARVRAVPEKGAANAALEKLLLEMGRVAAALESELHSAIDEKQDYAHAAGTVRKLRFLDKIREEIQQAIAALED